MLIIIMITVLMVLSVRACPTFDSVVSPMAAIFTISASTGFTGYKEFLLLGFGLGDNEPRASFALSFSGNF